MSLRDLEKNLLTVFDPPWWIKVHTYTEQSVIFEILIPTHHIGKKIAAVLEPYVYSDRDLIHRVSRIKTKPIDALAAIDLLEDLKESWKTIS